MVGVDIVLTKYVKIILSFFLIIVNYMVYEYVMSVYLCLQYDEIKKFLNTNCIYYLRSQKENLPNL